MPDDEAWFVLYLVSGKGGGGGRDRDGGRVEEKGLAGGSFIVLRGH